MKNVYRSLLFLHAFIGVGAIAGGLGAILNPNSPMSVPTDALKFSPFSNFLIPGIILFAVIGIGNIAAAVTALKKSEWQGYISGVFGGALVIWIVVQCIMLWDINILHIIYFVLGLVVSGMAALILFQKRMFPANIAISIYESMLKK